MKKILLWLPLLVAGFATAQHHCGTDDVHREKMLTDPEYAKRTNDFNAKNYGPGLAQREAPATYVIPVVVHIMHKGEAEGNGTNVSEALIKKKIQNINEAYRKITGTAGAGNGVDTGIEFALAVRDPEGNCTNGIDRVNMTGNNLYMNNGVKRNQNGSGITDTALKAISFWDATEYYNIWIVSEFDNGDTNIAGYAYYASAHGQAYDGAVILSTQFGDDYNPTFSHELGHALNLYHTFEGDAEGASCPPVINGCGSGLGDCCADTAPHIRDTDCSTLTENSCDPDNTNLDYAHNYMTYSQYLGCTNMFTQNQKTRMINALTQVRGSLLAQNGNMSLVPPATASPSFTVSPALVCGTGQTVKFTDATSCIPKNYLDESAWPNITFTWTVTNASVTYTSTQQNPQFTLNSAGSYNVTLRIVSPEGTRNASYPNAVTVTTAPATACTPRSGQTGNFAYTVNRVQFNGIDNITSSSLNGNYQDFTCTHNTMVNYDTTYALSLTLRSSSQYTEHYKVFIDYNNNGIFSAGEEVASGSNPPSSTNTYTHNIAIPATATRNRMLRMRIVGEAGTLTTSELNCLSNYFVDDIEDYGIYISSTQDTDVVEHTTVSIAPNPAETTFTISSQDIINSIKIYNLLGQQVLTQNIGSIEGLVNISQLSSGTYLIATESNGKIHQQKIIKK